MATPTDGGFLSSEAEFRNRLAEQLYLHYSFPDQNHLHEIRRAAPSWLALAGRYDASDADAETRRAFWAEMLGAGLPRGACACASTVEAVDLSFTQRALALVDFFNLDV